MPGEPPSGPDAREIEAVVRSVVDELLKIR